MWNLFPLEGPARARAGVALTYTAPPGRMTWQRRPQHNPLDG